MKPLVLALLSGTLCDDSMRSKRALGERNIMELVLSKEYCGLIESALDDCKIASCKDDDRNKVTPNGEIPVGAICRIKCRSVKATRCRCCKAGFEIGKKCPEAGDEDSCELEMDENALYEGPDAKLYNANDWRECYQECLSRGMNCHAASYVKLRFNSMCWIFNQVTTRYGEEPEEDRALTGPTRELSGLSSMVGVRSGRKNKSQFHQKKLFLPMDMRPIDHKSLLESEIAQEANTAAQDEEDFANMLGLAERSGGLPFRKPAFGGPSGSEKVEIAKGDAITGFSAAARDEPVMRSWYRKCREIANQNLNRG